MTTLDTLIERNQDFASHHFSKDLTLMPTLRAMIIGCVDPRVDPALLLGLKLGEAVVIRNVGGRITPGTLQTMGMLNRVAQVGGGNPAGEFHLIVLSMCQALSCCFSFTDKFHEWHSIEASFYSLSPPME